MREFGLGRFGDRRLEKGGLRFMQPLSANRAVVSAGSGVTGRRRCGFDAFCTIDR